MCVYTPLAQLKKKIFSLSNKYRSISEYIILASVLKFISDENKYSSSANEKASVYVHTHTCMHTHTHTHMHV